MTTLILQFVRAYFEKFVARHYVVITILSLVITALAVWTISTKWNINSDFKALLPETSAAAQAMTEVGDRVGSGSALFVVVDSPSTEANREFARVYAERMRELDEVALAHFHNDKTFFEKRQLLYMDVEDISTLHDRLKKRLREEKKAANPLFVSLKKKKKSDGLVDTADLEDKYADQAYDAHKEYLEADDGYSLTIVVRFVESSTDMFATNRLLDKVEKLGQELDPASFHPDMTVELGGGLAKRKAEYTSIMNDVVASAVFTVVGLFLVIGLYFRRLRAVMVIMVPLIMGILWTLAIAFMIFGELTTITVFIFAILLGLGIDFSIHLLSGFDHERFEGRGPVEALVRCYQSVGAATVIGATTTFATFVVLSFAQFKGLSEFGIVASIGVMCSLMAMLVVMPALILTAHRVKAHEPRPPSERASVMDRLANPAVVQRMAAPALVLAVVLTGVFAFQMSNLKFEENFRKIGEIEYPWLTEPTEQEVVEKKARASAKKLGEHLFDQARSAREAVEPDTFVMDREQTTVGSKYTSAVSGRQSSTPTIMLFDDREDAERVFWHMDTINEEELTTIGSLGSIYAFMPGTAEEQAERMVEIKKIEAMLDREGTAFLSDAQKEKVAELRERLDVEPFTIYDLPIWTKRLFKEAGPSARPPAEGEEFAFEYLIYLNEVIDVMRGDQAREFLAQVDSVAEQTGEDLRVGSQSYIYIAMLDEIKTDGLRMMLIALLVVFLMLSVAFRNPLRAAVALIPLTIGGIWMFGFMAWFGIRLDFFNVIIIPVVIGIGIDDGVHFYYRYLDKGRGSIPIVLRQVGSAVMMTSVTSTVGFGGLAITQHFGLKSIGYVAISGIGATLLATLLILPSLLYFSERYNLGIINGDKDYDPEA